MLLRLSPWSRPGCCAGSSPLAAHAGWGDERAHRADIRRRAGVDDYRDIAVRVVLMTRTKRLPAPLHGTDSPLSVVESMGQLSPERVRPMLRVASWLSAAWVLMATPTVAEPRPMDGRWGGPVTGQTRPRDRVTVVDMRPMRQVHTTTDATGRRLTTRHVVRGHWTHQPYGPKRSLRRLQWVAPFIRGPEGSPFVGTDTVTVWRR